MRLRGFTLIETIYSTLLLGFIIIALLNVYSGSFVAIKRGEGTLQADALAQAVLEDMRSQPYGNYTVGVGPAPSPTPWIYGTVTYEPTAEVFRPPGTNTSVDYLKGYRVKVTWKINNQLKQVTHEAYVHNIRR